MIFSSAHPDSDVCQAIDVSRLSYRYGARRALDEVSLSVDRGQIFEFLGPNGGGKTTLFRLLSTLIPLQSGQVRIFGRDLKTETHQVRLKLGVVFQAPSLDRKLTVVENIRQQAALYGVHGNQLARRQEELVNQLGLAERLRDRVETLSGGLRRRVELAKGMIHRPQLLLLDEPSTGLDPGARSDLWEYLQRLRDELGVTIVMTTHLLEEAERADQLAILHQGKIVAAGAPESLKATVGGDSIAMQTGDPTRLAADISQKFDVAAQVVDGQVRFEQPNGQDWIPRLMQAFGERIQSIRLGKPTLEDVFIAKTGHRFWRGDAADE